MNLTDLLDEFNVVIDTAEGLTELRSLILGLAMTGRLTAHRKDEKFEGEILQHDLNQDHLYPDNWIIVKLKRVVKTQNGYAFKSKKFNDVGHGMPLIRIRDLYSKDTEAYYEGEFREDYIVNKGDLLVGMDGNFNVALWQGPEALLNQRVCRLFPNDEYLKKELLYYFIQKFLNDIHEDTTYTTVKHLSAKQIKSIEFPLPPLAEQHRIVKRIESLFAEVDELEEKLNRQTKLDQKLQMAVNAEVQQAPDAEASKSAWNFITTNFDTLYHTPEAINNLKKNILNEAVRGRLVPQNPKEEPASELLKKIEAEKERLYHEGEIRKPKELPPVKKDEIPFEIPESWEWCRLADVTNLITDGKHGDCRNEENSGYYFISAKDINDQGELTYSNARQIMREDFEEVHRRTDLELGDLMVSNAGSIGKIAIAKNEQKVRQTTFQKSVAVVKPTKPYLDSKYLELIMLANVKIMMETSQGIAMKNLLLRDMRKMIVTLPPLEEQHRIVQRIEELFSICDRFKAELQQRQAVNERLVKGLVGEVLEGS